MRKAFYFGIAALSAVMILLAGCSVSESEDETNSTGSTDSSITSVSISAGASSISATGSTTLIATPVTSGSPTITYTWSITAGSDYAALSSTSGSSVTLTGTNTTTSNQSVKVKVIANDGTTNKTATTTVTVEAASSSETASLNSVTISGTSAIEATATGTLTATPSYTGDIASSITYAWSITSGSDYATISGSGTSATITGKNTDSSSHEVTVKVTATYDSASVTDTHTVTVAAVETTVENALTDLSLATSATSVAPDGTVTITPTATYTGSLSESDFTVSDWSITSGSSYASLLVPSTGAARSTVTFTGDNTSTLQAANTTTSSQTVTVSVTVSYGEVSKTATCDVTVQAAAVSSVSISGTTSIDCTGTTTLTADVSKTGSPANITYSWEITSGSSYAALSSTTDSSVTLTGTNTTASAQSVTVKVTVSDGSNSVTNTQTVTVAADSTATTSSAYFPANGEENAYADTYLELTFDSAPTIDRSASGSVKIYSSDGTLVDTINPAAETMYGYGYSGNSGLGSINVQYQLIQVIDTNTVRIIPHHNTSTGLTLLEPGTGYYVLIDDGIISGTLNGSTFAGITEATTWAFTTASTPTISSNTITVGSDKNFITVQGAFSYMMENSKTGDWTINIDSGTYYERIFYSGSANITLSGQGTADYGTDVEIQWCNQDGGEDTTLWNYGSRGRNVFYFKGGDLILENISLVNTATRMTNDYGEYDASGSDTASGNNQAEALMFDSTGNCAAYNCNFTSKQDTVYLSPSGGKAWFYGCQISGDVDFIWGLSDVALFEECNIISAYDEDKSSNHITYVVASHLATDSAPYGKGFVLYNCDITTEDGQTTYLARSPWGSSGNVAQVAIIDTAVTGGLADSPWYGNHVGGDDETVLGWKSYGVTSDGSTITDSYAISASQYTAEFAGRRNILNRTYDGSSFSKASSTWDVDSLISEMGWTVTTDNSLETLSGESETTTIIYDFRELTGYDQWASFTSMSPTSGSADDITLTSFRYHSTGYGANTSAANATVTIPVTGACTVTVYNSYTTDTEVSLANGSTSLGSGTAAASSSYALSYTGSDSTSLTLTIASSGTYISKIEVTYTSEASSSDDDDDSTTTEDSWTLTGRSDSPFSSLSSSASSLSEDATVAGADGVLTLTLSASGTGVGSSSSNTPSYKYNSSNGLCIKNAALKIGGITGDVTLTITGKNSGSSERNLEVTVGSSGTVETQAVSTSTTFTYTKDFTGDDTTVYIGASNELYIGTISIESNTFSSVTISGSSTVSVGNSITLTATPNATPSNTTYTWSIASGTSYVSLSSSSSNTVTATGLAAGSATITATVDGVTSSAYTVTVTEGNSISSSDTPVGWASYSASSCFGNYSSYTTVTVSNKSDFVNYAQAGGYLIYVNGEIDLSEGMLPSAYDESTTTLDSWIASTTSNAYTSLSAWRLAYAAACSSTTNDKSSSSPESDLGSTLWTLADAYKSVIQVSLASNTMIIGLDENAVIKGGCLMINGISNVTLRNLTIKDAYDPFPHHEKNDGFNAQYDCITVQGTCSHIWIDHCTIMDSFTDHLYVTLSDGSTTEKWVTYDGLCDMKGSLTYATVSYCKLSSHDKTMLIGSSDTESFTGTRTITLHHNYFNDCVQRLPMVRITNLHAFNNYYDFTSYSATKKTLDSNGDATSATETISNSYCIGVRAKAQIVSENNYFSSGTKYAYSGSSATADVDDVDCVSTTLIYISGDSNNSSNTASNSSYYTVSSSMPWTPSDSYSYTLDSVSDLPTTIPANAGAGVWEVSQ